MTDATTTVAALRSRVDTFVKARDWEKFHRLSNLAKAISVEAAELLELFQWRGESDPLDVPLRTRAEEELADGVIYCLSAANSLDLDLSDAVLRKLKRNEAKYPVREWRGGAGGGARAWAGPRPAKAKKPVPLGRG